MSSRRPRRYRPASTEEQIGGAAAVIAGLIVALVLAAFAGNINQTGVFPTWIWKALAGIGTLIIMGVGVIFWLELRNLHQRLRRQRALQLSDIDEMSGRDFELYMAGLLEGIGFQEVKLTPAQQDNGTDVLFSHDGVRYAAQLKRYRNLVGIDALYQASGGKDYYKANKAVVITNSYFNPYTIDHAEKAGIWLVDRDTLSEWILRYQNSGKK